MEREVTASMIIVSWWSSKIVQIDTVEKSMYCFTYNIILIWFNNFLYRCACATGLLSNDGKHCRELSLLLIFAIQKEVHFLSWDGRSASRSYPPIADPQIKHPAIAVDFDYEEKLIFFTVLRKSIMSVYINGSELREMSLTCELAFHDVLNLLIFPSLYVIS